MMNRPDLVSPDRIEKQFARARACARSLPFFLSDSSFRFVTDDGDTCQAEFSFPRFPFAHSPRAPRDAPKGAEGSEGEHRVKNARTAAHAGRGRRASAFKAHAAFLGITKRRKNDEATVSRGVEPP